jgi:hypothetical protein
MIAGGPGTPLLDAPLVLFAAFVLSLEIVAERDRTHSWQRSARLRAAATSALLLALELAGYTGTPAQFVYFKF